MTTTTPLLRPLDRAPRLTFAHVVDSERTKLLTLRSTALVGLLVFALTAAAGASVAATDATDPAGALADGVATTVRTISYGDLVGQLFVAVLAVLVVTQEHATGQGRTTYAAVPRRLPVLAAKTLVAAAAVAVLSVVSSIAAWGASTAVLWSTGLRTSLLAPEVLQVIGGTAAWLVLLAVVSVMIATLLRSSAAAIAVVFGLLFVLPLAVTVLSQGAGSDLSVYLLTYAGGTMDHLFTGTEPAADLGRDLAVVAAWLVVPAVAAGWATVRRDV